ncbi:MAG TPA: CPBP family intramembrane glutamic endopeptidase [Candidatus Limnocylindrales bacterium]|nr:CPBP family intramembrane glutamic endopeptidase [Candidatus Limnocylindrales bacterium]
MGVAGSSGRREGWSPAPFATRLPVIGLVIVVALAAVIRPAAPIVFVGLLFVYLIGRLFAGRSALAANLAPGAVAAVLPVAAILVWRSLPEPAADPTGADCANLVAPPAIWRLLEAGVGLITLVLLVRDRRGSLGDLGFRRGSRNVRLVAVAGLLVFTPIAIYAGTMLGGSALGDAFFGSYTLNLSQPLAFLPAVVFAASNALAEELAYRGAMRVWLAPTLGVMGANLAQAVVYGLSHTGDDFAGPEGMIPAVAATIAVGFLAGVITRRTNSLTIALAVHAAADIPIYLYWACRIA